MPLARWTARAARARVLADRYPASREVLVFYAGLAEWLVAGPDNLLPGLVELVERTGPDPLRQAERTLDWAPLNFFGRVVAALGAPERCDGCDAPPQAGCLIPQGEGQALELVCARCFGRRASPRGRCPACSDQKLVYFSAPEFPHLQLQACESCHAYLLLVDLARDPDAIPEVDELAGLPLDLWAQEQGYRKLCPNLAGV